MKKTIKNIYLTWRTGKGDRRIPIGRIKKNSSEGIIFSYFKNKCEKVWNYTNSVLSLHCQEN